MQDQFRQVRCSGQSYDCPSIAVKRSTGTRCTGRCPILRVVLRLPPPLRLVCWRAGTETILLKAPGSLTTAPPLRLTSRDQIDELRESCSSG